MYQPWQLAARKMVAEACESARLAARGARKTHVPYNVPDWCYSLLEAVENDDEHETKRIMHVVRTGCLTMV